MTDDHHETDQERERRLKQWAMELGLMVVKSTGRTMTIHDRLGYMIFSRYIVSTYIMAGQNFDLTLDAVEDYLRKFAHK